jgi:predicted GNAT family acetyltransferase
LGLRKGPLRLETLKKHSDDLGSMISNYMFEKNNLEILHDDYGFMFYLRTKEAFIITDCFIKPEHRKQGHGKSLLECLEEVAKAAGVHVIKSLVGDHKFRSDSLAAQLKVGFKVVGAENGNVYLEKRLV